MLLAVDVANTNTVFGLLAGDRVVHHFRLRTVDRSTDELGALMLQLFAVRGVKPAEVTGVIVSSVVPSVLYTLDRACGRYLSQEPLVVGRKLKTGMRVRTDNPREIGSDRIVNAVSAFKSYGGPLVVVDLGAATTVDAIDDNGDFLGGAIAPGFTVAEEVLFTRTAKLPRVAIEVPDRVIGKNTISSLQAGLVYGYAGLIDALVERSRAELHPEARVVATGDMATLFSEVCRSPLEVDPWLTLRGLRAIYDRNA